MSWKGIYGAPRNLVTAAVDLLCNAIKENALERPTKLVLMNTSGNSNRDLDEPISKGQKYVMALLRLLLPPHVAVAHQPLAVQQAAQAPASGGTAPA